MYYALCFIEYNFFCDKLITEARLLDESLDLTEHRAERSSVNKTVREIEKKIGHTSQLSFSDENNWDNFVLTYLNFQGCATQETMLSLIGVCYTVQKKKDLIFFGNPIQAIVYFTVRFYQPQGLLWLNGLDHTYVLMRGGDWGWVNIEFISLPLWPISS